MPAWGLCNYEVGREMMNARVDYAIMPPGLIRGAICYSLVMDTESLYLIRVSRGWKVGYAPRGLLEDSVASSPSRSAAITSLSERPSTFFITK